MRTSRQNELRPLADMSFDVQFGWALRILSSSLSLPKKHIRSAWRIIKNPHLEAEIMEKGKPVKRMFHYGFRRFFIREEKKEREIRAPHPKVQMVFDAIRAWLEKISFSHENAYGFVKGRNPQKAAEALLKNVRFPLLANKHFFGFDIAEAFPSITTEMVEDNFKELNVDEAIIKIIAWLVTHYYRDQRRLPQGSSCSPAILNRVYLPMCEKMRQICKKHYVNWVVYADDFNFAGLDISQELKNELLAVPPKYGFKVKEQKTRDNKGKTIPQILGLTIVNGEIHIRRGTKKRFRRIMFAAMKFNAYSSECVSGIAAHIKSIYGEEKNWPGWLLKPLKEYWAKQAERKD